MFHQFSSENKNVCCVKWREKKISLFFNRVHLWRYSFKTFVEMMRDTSLVKEIKMEYDARIS